MEYEMSAQIQKAVSQNTHLSETGKGIGQGREGECVLREILK